MDQNLWNSFIEKIRLREMLFLQGIGEEVKGVLLEGEYIKTNIHYLSDKNEEMQLFKGTMKDIILQTHIMYKGKLYVITQGEPVDLCFWCEGEDILSELFEHDDDNYHKLEIICSTFNHEYLKYKNIKLPKFDFNKAIEELNK